MNKERYLMDFREIEFEPELNKFYKECLNNGFVRIDKIYCWCELHKCYVSKNQAKNRNCYTDCKYKRAFNTEVCFPGK